LGLEERKMNIIVINTFRSFRKLINTVKEMLSWPDAANAAKLEVQNVV